MGLTSRQYRLLIFIVVMASYYTVIFSSWCLVDDYTMIMSVPDPGQFDLLKTLFPHGVKYYRPLVSISFYLENLVWMCHESFMHLDNALLHLINSLLVFSLALEILRLRGEDNPVPPFIAALLFALYPNNTESVAWISGRPDPLAGVFVFAGLILLLRGLRENRVRSCFFATISLFIAALAKETAVFVYPACLFFVFIIRNGGMTRREGDETGTEAVRQGTGTFLRGARAALSWIRDVAVSIQQRPTWYLIMTLYPVCYLLMRKAASRSEDRSVGKLLKYATSEQVDSSWWEKIFTAFKCIGFYLKKIFIPWPLNFTIVDVSNWYILLGLVIVPLVLILLWRRTLTAALFLAAICLASPAIFVAVGKLAWVPFAERYLYLASAPFLIGMVLVVRDRLSPPVLRESLLRVGVILLVGAFAVTTVSRNLAWMDGLSIYEDAYRQSPYFDRTIRNYAAALAREGRDAEANRLRPHLQYRMKKMGGEGSFTQY